MKTIKAKNGKSYTKKQICEAIEYWKKQLNESFKSCDPDEHEAYMCYSYLRESYESGDEGQLWIGESIEAIADSFAIGDEYYDVTIQYGNAKASYRNDINGFYSIFKKMYNDSVAKKHNVKAIVSDISNDSEDPYESTYTFNFAGTDYAVNARNIFLCN